MLKQLPKNDHPAAPSRPEDHPDVSSRMPHADPRGGDSSNHRGEAIEHHAPGRPAAPGDKE